MANRQSPHPNCDAIDRRVSDRRDGDRFPSEGRIRFLRAGAPVNEVIGGELLDASPRGIRILLDEPLIPADRLLVEVRNDDEQCFNLTAEVIWIEAAENSRFCVGCGLSVELSDRQFELLGRIARGTSSF